MNQPNISCDSSTMTMMQLPIELKKMILSNLSIVDALRSKCVCKQWQAIVETIRYRELSIVRQNAYKQNIWRVYTYEPKCSDRAIKLTDDRALRSLARAPCFESVIKMSTLFTNHSFYLTDFFNQFRQLEELTIASNNSFSDSIKREVTRSKIVLGLDRLRRLTVKTNYYKFKLNTPHLTTLTCKTFLVDYEFEYAHRLTHLDAECVYDYRFPVLINLRVLVVRHELTFSFRQFFSQMPNLKQLHLCYDCNVEKILSHKDEEQHFEVFVHGFAYDCMYRNFRKRNFLRELLVKRPSLLVQNLSSLCDHVRGEFELNYSELEKSCTAEQLDILIEKFGDEEMKIVFLDERVRHVDQLLDFLMRSRPVCLKIKNSRFSQPLLDSLPKLQFIREFHFNAKRLTHFAQLNGFLFKMTNLEVIKLKNNSFSISFVVEAFQTMRSLREIGFFENPFSLIKNYRAFFLSNFTENSISICIPHTMRYIKGRRKKEFPSKQALLRYLIDLDRKAMNMSQIYEIFV